MEEDIVKKIKRSQKLIAAIASVLLYVVIFYCSIVIMPQSSEKALPPEPATSAADASYQEYKDYVSDTNKGIKNLLDGQQLRNTIYNDDIDNTNYGTLPRTDNPFGKFF